MSRTYRLKPTPPDRKLRDRPWYHELRLGLLAARAKANGGLTKAEAPAPNLVDWSEGSAPVRDQGQEGCCSGFQSRNVRWIAHWLAMGSPPAADFAPAYAYWAARCIEGTCGSDSGANIGDELAGMEEAGICEESFMPYVAGDYATRPTADALANAATHKVDLQAVPVRIDLASIHEVLGDRHPIIGGFSVTQQFEDCPSNGILADPSGDSLGLHAFSWDQCNLTDKWGGGPNSWGASWGRGGRYCMGEKWVGQIVELWAIVPCL
jgi:Papain family cysteine protease